MGFDVPFYWYYDIYILTNQTMCTTSNPYNQFYLDLTNLLISTIIPFILMACCSSIIGHHLITNKMRLICNRPNYNKEMQLVKIMFATNVFFLICNLPFCIQVKFNSIFIFYSN